ncbi:MAG: hypothetical protein JNJ97_04285, partial [Alphaproteobacteria bacterium]|nr:hypothetical protein [Alphaproteobacteria bacterium]
MLRQKLHEITEKRDLSSHKKLIGDLQEQYAHTIKIKKRESSYGFNCVMHALDMIDHPEVVRLSSIRPDEVYTGAEFMHFLIDGKYLSEKLASTPGLLAVYFDNKKFKHVGLLLSETRLESKWGCGHLYEHDLIEVPISYGNDIRYCT